MSVVDQDRQEARDARWEYERSGPLGGFRDLAQRTSRPAHPWLVCLCDRCKRFREARMLPGPCQRCHRELYGRRVDDSYLTDVDTNDINCSGLGVLHLAPKVVW